MKKYLFFTACVLLVSLLAFSCQKKEGLRVGVTLGDLSNPFFVQLGKGAEAKAKELDRGAKVSVVSGNYDLGAQSTQIDDFIAAGVQIIVLNAVDSTGIVPAVQRAKDAGIIVIAVDVSITEGADATVMSDNVQAGEIVAQYLVDKLNGTGNVVIVNGPPVSAVLDRVAGAQSVFSQYPDIKVVSDNQNAGGSRDGGFRVMTDLLTSLPSVDAVFGINDPTAIGASLAVVQAGRQADIFVVGVDGSPDAQVELAGSESVFEATAAQDPYTMAATAVEVGYNMLNGTQPEMNLILIPVTLVTKENAASYQGWTSGQ